MPPCLRRDTKGPWACTLDKRDDAESDGGGNEVMDMDGAMDEEMTREHAGFEHAILPRPDTADGLSKGQAVVVFFQAPEASGTGWFDGTLTKVRLGLWLDTTLTLILP